MALRPVHVFALVIAGGGSIFLTIGLVFLISDGPEREAARVAALTVFDTGTWKKAAPGTTVLVEGRIAAGTPPVFRDFVACRREKYTGMKTEGSGSSKRQVEQWSLIGVFAPPLRLEGPGDGLPLVKPDYELRDLPHAWRAERVESNLFETVGERAAGFVVGDLVTAEGRVVEGGLEAVLLLGGDAATYRAATRRNVEVTGVLGLVFTPLGFGLVALGAFIAWRLGRRASTARASSGG